MPARRAARSAAMRDLHRQDVRIEILERLDQGPARVVDLASHVRHTDLVHGVIRDLRDEGRIHADSGYWVLGPARTSRW